MSSIHPWHVWPWRLRRFWRSLRPRFGPVDHELLTALRPPERQAFLALKPADRRHALDVAREVKRRAPRLVRAALLHDLGKGGTDPTLMDRVLVALGFTPARLADYRDHPRRGEQLGRELGLEPEVLFIIRYHHERLKDLDLRLIQEADRRW